MKKKSLILLTTLLSFSLTVALNSCKNAPLQSISKEGTLAFSHSVYNERIIFGGDVNFKNVSANDISDIRAKASMLTIEYQDGSLSEFNIIIFASSENCPVGGTKQLKFAIDPMENDHPYIDLDGFKRTPKNATLKASITTISTNHEATFDYSVNVLSQWIKFQKDNGFRN